MIIRLSYLLGVFFRYNLHLRITPDGRAYAYNFSLQQSDLYLAKGCVNVCDPQRYPAGVYYQHDQRRDFTR
jgi:hypothetical protein